MKKETVEKKQKLIHQNHKLLTGEISDKHAILLDDGKTIVFISDKSKEAEIRLKYNMLNRFSKL